MDPSKEYCANKQRGLKPPQETTCLFYSEIGKKLPNKIKKLNEVIAL